MTFYEWVAKRKVTDDILGDFVQDAKYDKKTRKIENNKESWELYLTVCGACSEAHEAFQKLWKLYYKSSDVELPADVGYVYFINAGPQLFKIGMTNQNPYKRLSTIQTGCPYPVEMYKYIETKTPRQVEEKLHQMFKDQRLQGEWFSITTEDVEMAVNELLEG